MLFSSAPPFPPRAFFLGLCKAMVLRLARSSPLCSSCFPSQLEGMLLCVSRGGIRCQIQNLCLLESQAHRFSLIPFCRGAGAEPLEPRPVLRLHPPTPPGRQEPSLPRGPKGHLTKQPGLLQHCCSEGFRLCFLLNSLSLVKEISQRLGLITASIFLPRSGVFVHFAPEPICQARHGGAIRELTQPVWARSPQCCCR